MNKVLQAKIIEAFSSVLPITVIVLIVSVVLVPVEADTVLMFVIGSALLILGIGFFSLGVDMAMLPMGEGIGIQIVKIPILPIIIIISFAMGVIIAVAEPNLMVFAQQITTLPFWYIIGTVAIGVGFFLVVAVLRTLFKIPFVILLIIFWGIAFALSFFTDELYVPLSFEAGSVVTGPIVVPFILAIGIGLASVRSDKHSYDDSFGLIALCGIGPVIAVLILVILANPQNMEMESEVLRHLITFRDIILKFILEMPHNFKDVAGALGTILLCFVVLQLVSRRYKRHQLIRIGIGFIYTLLGLVFFLTGANIGFIPMGQLLGYELASSHIKWVLIPLGALIGYFIVAAEPSVPVLNKQVEDVTSGAITAKMMNIGLSIGLAVALSITMARILFEIPIMFILLPGYVISLVLSFFVPKIVTAIAFDAGAVCTGPMSATFLLPLALGTAEGSGKDTLMFAFGIVAIVAVTPIVIIQFMGLIFGRKMKSAAETVVEEIEIEDMGAIVEFEEFV